MKYRKRAVDKSDVEKFLQQIAAIQNAKNYAALTHWYVSKGGFTAPAQALLQELGIYYTDLAQFNALAKLFGIGGPGEGAPIIKRWRVVGGKWRIGHDHPPPPLATKSPDSAL